MVAYGKCKCGLSPVRRMLFAAAVGGLSPRRAMSHGRGDKARVFAAAIKPYQRDVGRHGVPFIVTTAPSGHAKVTTLVPVPDR